MKLTSLLILTTSALLITACGGGGPKGDPIAGKQVYVQCAGCHQLQQNAAGPRHCGVVGRAAGTVADYSYSEAMKDSGLVWDEKTLDEFLVSPIAYVHGTKMGFAGLGDASDRANVIAYLRDVGRDPAVCPPN